jgi:hypothetical protein
MAGSFESMYRSVVSCTDTPHLTISINYTVEEICSGVISLAFNKGETYENIKLSMARRHVDMDPDVRTRMIAFTYGYIKENYEFAYAHMPVATEYVQDSIPCIGKSKDGQYVVMIFDGGAWPHVEASDSLQRWSSLLDIYAGTASDAFKLDVKQGCVFNPELGRGILLPCDHTVFALARSLQGITIRRRNYTWCENCPMGCGPQPTKVEYRPVRKR